MAQNITLDSIVNEEYKNIIVSLSSNAKDSICYSIPEGFRAPGVILVISPYVERINDEIEYLTSLDITATTITSVTTTEERESIYANFNQQFFFVTPEMIEKGFKEVRNFIYYLLDSEVCSVVVENADLSMDTFRESYQVLKNVRTNFPDIQWIALTKETDDEEIQSIASSLSMTTYNKNVKRG